MFRRGLLLQLGILLAAVLTAGQAAAYWRSAASGSGVAQAGTLTAPVTSATSTPGIVTASWTASTGTSAPIGYYVVRSDSSNVPAAACGTTPIVTISALTCTESGIAAGTYTYTVTAVSRTWTATSTPASVTVAPGASKVVFTTQPTNSTGGVAFPAQPAVAIENSSGTVITMDTSAVTVALQTAGGATLSCAANPRSAVAGVATFSACAINMPGTYNLVATDGTLTSATSVAFTISVGPAAKLAFTVSPTDSFAGGAFYSQPAVAVQDAGGNTVSTNTSSVTLVITAPQGASLVCSSNPKPASSGNATFTGCAIDNAGTYTLTASDGLLASALSAQFAVSAAPRRLAWSGDSTTVCTTRTGTQFALVFGGCSLILGVSAGSFASNVLLTDASGTAVVNLGVDITVTLTPVTGSVSPVTVTIAHGQSVSSASSTFRPGYGPLGPSTDTVTASAPTLVSATAKLNA
jgi:trimeric autotransporter adhesin